MRGHDPPRPPAIRAVGGRGEARPARDAPSESHRVLQGVGVFKCLITGVIYGGAQCRSGYIVMIRGSVLVVVYWVYIVSKELHCVLQGVRVYC